VLGDDAVVCELVLASVAETGHRVAGFAGICPSRDPVEAGLGELDTIAVDPWDWRTGVGRALMAVALDTLRGTGYAEAIVWTSAGCLMADAETAVARSRSGTRSPQRPARRTERSQSQDRP
jgi:N-acetylglutamate synthase-like GNAT family acetyltransferase